MATTTNYSWTTPDDTDLVKDGAAAIRTLGTAIDTTVFTNAGAAINKTIIDAAGDLIYGTADDTPARLAIGTAGQALLVNSGATAPEWGIVPSFYPNMSPRNAGGWLNGRAGSTTFDFNHTANRTYYVPIFLPGHSFDRIGFRTASSWSGTSNVRLGLYNADQATGKPTTVYLDAGTVSANAGSTVFTITISNTPPAGFYFVALNVNTGATNRSIEGLSAFTPPYYLAAVAAANGPTDIANAWGFIQDGVSGAFATAVPVVNTSNFPIIGLRMV